MFGAHYLEKDWRYRLGYNGAPIGNGPGVSTGADLTGGHLCSGRLGHRPVTSWGPLE